MAKETTEKKLYDLLSTRDYKNFQALDSRTGKVPTNPQTGAQDVSQADMFVFDWSSSRGKHYGTAVILLTPEHELELYFGDNLGKTMEDPTDKNEWFAFMEQLRHFATRTNFNGFRPLNINQLRHSLQGQAAIKEGLFESWQGRKNMSWSAGPTEARLMIKHKRNLDETDARHLYIESLFIETAEGERYKLPFNKLTGGRAMLEHVRQGGRPYDIRGQHITDIVEELNVLGRFERSVARETVLEGDTAQLVSEAAVYRKSLKENLKRLGTGRGYATYFESWNPVELTEQDVVIESLKHMFVKQTLDARIEQALPVLARIQQQGNAMKEANIFEAWADRLVEGTWSTPDSPEAQQKLLELMSKELPVGADATNATEQLYDLLGDDKLFDLLESLAQQDPNADCRQVILDRMQELSDNPDVRAVLEQLNIDADATMNPPESMPADLEEGVMDSLKGVISKIKAVPGIQSYIKVAQDKKEQLIQALQKSSNGAELLANIKQVMGAQPAVAEGVMDRIGAATAASAGGGIIAFAAAGVYNNWEALGKPDLSTMAADAGTFSTLVPGMNSGQSVLIIFSGLIVIGALAMFMGINLYKQHSKQDAEREARNRPYQEEQAMAEGSKRLPDIRQFDKTVLDKQFGGSIVKMAQALKDAGFSHERIVQKINDFKQGMAEGSDHSLKKVFDRYARHLSASRGDTSDVDQMMRSSKILKDITKYVRDNYGEDAVDNMERYANRQPGVTEDAVRSLRRAAGLTEGRMLDEDKSKLDHILDRFKYEVRNFEQGGDLDDDLYDALFDYYSDTGEMPYGTAKARDGDPYEWVAQNLESHLRGGGIIGGVPDEDYSLERESAGNYAPEEMRAPHSVDGGMDNSILYDDSTCNMSEAGEPCPTHGLEECWTESTVPAPMEEKSPLAGIYGHSGKMQEVGKDTSFLDRLKTLSGMAKS